MYDDYPEYEFENSFEYDGAEDREYGTEIPLAEDSDWDFLEVPLAEDQYVNHFY